jgi:hypothetical protein
LPLVSVKRLFPVSHASADVEKYAGFAASTVASGSALAEKVVTLYCPAAQTVQLPPFAPPYPELHVQATIEVLEFGEVAFAGHRKHAAAAVAPMVVEYVPVRQSVHAALPVAILYFPAAHGAHTPPSGPVDPALQVQAAGAKLAIGELEFGGHATQVAAVVAAVVAEYVSAEQAVHAAEPLAFL